jgi:glycosyltransferase involved in cell wall biosynthesis
MSDTTLDVANFAQLNAAILQADQDATAGDGYTITLTASFAESGDLDALNLHAGVDVTINGGGYTLDGGGLYRGLFVYAGDVTVQGLTIADARAVGGTGGTGGGGGGAGLGGGLFVASAGTVTLSGVTFTDDAATGGAGGAGDGGDLDGGGGGGLGGAGGAGNPTLGEGGGGGGVGSAAAGGSDEGAGGAGIVTGATHAGTSLSGGAGGVAGGGGGGGNTRGGGGGGVGGHNAKAATAGRGGFGGGGGGTNSTSGSAGAGAGSFGGGGGGGSSYGGAGGFGGGGGGGGSAGGGGFGGGDGGPSGGGGGGGLGAGGDIFVQTGGSLTIEGGTLGAGTVNPGAGGTTPISAIYGDQAGSAFGSAIFLQATTTLAPAAGQTLMIDGTIADQSGAIPGTVYPGSAGLVIDGAGTVDLAAANSFTGGTTLTLGTLLLGAARAAGSGGIVFENDPTLAFSIADAPTNVISGFAPGDTIDITDLTTMAAQATLAIVGTTDVLSIPYSSGDGGTLQLYLDPTGTYTGDVFDLAAATAPLTGTVLTLQATCYGRGTLILTDRGEVPVEDLRIGDRVVTHAGDRRPIRWIGRRAYNGIFAAGKPGILPVRIAAGALADAVPRRDLLVSPQHAMLIDGLLIPAAALVNGRSIVQAESVDRVEYFHVELDSHDVIVAEGAPSESFVDDDNRAMFDNADEYHALYPGAMTVPARYCAPRVEDGEDFEAIRRRLAIRADPASAMPLPVADGAPADHPALPRGYLDEATRTRVRGWAWNPDRPEAPIEVEVLHDGAVIATVAANRYRADLEAARIGSGRHAFEVTIPGGLSPLTRHAIVVRTAEGGVLLENAPVIIEPATRFDDGLAHAVASACAALDAPAEQDRVLNFLAAQMERVLQQGADAAAQREARQAHRQFRRRWGPGADAAAIDPAFVGDPGLRALVIDQEVPAADRDAGSQAILSHMRALRALGYAVSFVAADLFAEGAASAETVDGLATLEREAIVCCRLPAYASVEEVLRRQARCFDVVYLHRLSNASKYLALVRQHCPRARVIYSVADLHHLRLARQARIEQRDDLLAESRRVRLVECMAALSADAVLTHSAHEAALLRRAVPGAAVHVVPWAIPSPRRGAVDGAGDDGPWDHGAWDDSERNGVAFIANYGHEPNVDAARFLAETIMPLVWRQDPTIACVLAGSRMPPSIRRLARPGPSAALLTLGHVPDLEAVFDRVRLTVAPLRYGAGIKGKVLASFAAGLPCVMSPIAAEGIALPAALSACVGASAAELADLILRLHADAALRREAAHAGRALIETDFAAPRVTAALKAAIEGRHRAAPIAVSPPQQAAAG